MEDENHFMLHYSKFLLLRNVLFDKLNIEYHDLNLNEDQCFKIFNRLMNPVNVEETSIICGYTEKHSKSKTHARPLKV